MHKYAWIVGSCALLSVVPAQSRRTVATGAERYADMSARSFRKLTVSGEAVAKNVKRLTTELRWHKTLRAALAESRKTGKPVVWIQALGDLTGFL